MDKFSLKKYFWSWLQSTLIIALFSPLLVSPAAPLITPPATPASAKIGIVTLMLADNNLHEFALGDTADIVAAKFDQTVRSFVVWDKPDDDITWRLELQSGDSLDRGSFTGGSDLGTNPKQELIDMSSWFLQWVNPKIMIVNMWSHASGIKEPNLSQINRPIAPSGFVPKSVTLAARSVAKAKIRSLQRPSRNRRGQIQQPRAKKRTKAQFPLVSLPGAESRWPGATAAIQKGFGFDDTQKTYLTTKSMKEAIAGIKKNFKKPIDIMLFDACLMGLLEIIYALKDLVELIVASPNSVPGDGMPYNAIFNWLGSNPDAPRLAIAMQMVTLFGQYYRDVAASATNPALVRNAQRATFAVLNVAAIASLVDAFTSLISAVNACAAIDQNKTKTAVRAVRTAIANTTTLQFDLTDYVDVKLVLQQFITAFSALAPAAMPVVSVVSLAPLVEITDDSVGTDQVATVSPELFDPSTEAQEGAGITPESSAETKGAPKKPAPKKPAPKKPAPKPTSKPTAKPAGKPVVTPPNKGAADYASQAQRVVDVATAGLAALNSVVLKCTAGVGLANSCGLNVYYPAQGGVDASYPNCDFAKKTGWDKFITKYQ